MATEERVTAPVMLRAAAEELRAARHWQRLVRRAIDHHYWLGRSLMMLGELATLEELPETDMPAPHREAMRAQVGSSWSASMVEAGRRWRHLEHWLHGRCNRDTWIDLREIIAAHPRGEAGTVSAPCPVALNHEEAAALLAELEGYVADPASARLVLSVYPAATATQSPRWAWLRIVGDAAPGVEDDIRAMGVIEAAGGMLMLASRAPAPAEVWLPTR